MTRNKQSGQDGSGAGRAFSRPADDGEGFLSNPAGGAARRPTGTEAAATQISPTQVTSIARKVVGQLAPHELVLFNAVAQSWARGDQPRRRRPGSAAGLGVEEILLSQLVFPIIAGALGQVLGTVLTGKLSKKPRKREPAPAVTTTAAGGPGTEDQPLMLTGPQARQFYDACLRHGQDLGMPPDKATLLADVCLGAVHSARPL